MAAPKIILSEQERERLQAIANSPASSARLVTRARIILALGRKRKINEVSKALDVSVPTVALWRDRFLKSRTDALVDRQDPASPESELRRLLDAAERTVSKRGFCFTRVSDIAREAKVSSSTIMYYFESRQDILVRAMEHANRVTVNRFEHDYVGEEGSAVNRLATFLQSALPNEGSQNDEYLMELDLLSHARQHPEFVQIWDEHQGRWISGLAAILHDGISEGAFIAPRVELSSLARSTLAMIDGYGYQLAVGATIVTRESMLEAVTQYLSDALQAPVEQLRSTESSQSHIESSSVVR